MLEDDLIMSIMLGRGNTWCTSDHIYFTRYIDTSSSFYQDIHQDQDTPDSKQTTSQSALEQWWSLVHARCAQKGVNFHSTLWVCKDLRHSDTIHAGSCERHVPPRDTWHVTAVPGVTRLVTCVTVGVSSQLWRNTRQLVAPPIIQGLKEASIFW